MRKHTFQPGQQVRVGRCDWHGIKFGAVCRVIEDCGDGDLLVAGPVNNPGWDKTQYVDGNNCRLAKQAMKKG